MKTPFIPTAMRCTQKQFEAIKPKLIERGCEIIAAYGFSDNTPYLEAWVYQNEKHITITATSKNGIEYGSKIYEEWNEEIFLRNLGGEEVKEASIEQLYKASNDEADKWTKPTYDRGMMAATILGKMIAAGYEVDYELAQRQTDKLISQLNQTL